MQRVRVIDDQLVTAREIAEAFRLNPRTVKSRVRKGGFPKPAVSGQGVADLWALSEVREWYEQQRREVAATTK